MKETSYYAYPGIPKTNEEIVNLVLKRAEEKFGLSREQLASPSRKKEISQSRQIIQYALRVKTTLTYQQIAQLFNRQDHTTAKYSHKTIQGFVDVNPEIRAIVNEILIGIF